jgi:hypothetical protein
MFITNNAFYSPIHSVLADAGDSYWTAAEVALHQMWFLVALRVVDRSGNKPFELERTLLLSDIQQVAHFVSSDNSDFSVRTVNIITPKHVNGTRDWAMEELVRIWNAQEPDASGHATPLYETKSGKRYCYSQFATPVEEMKIQSLWLEFPTINDSK